MQPDEDIRRRVCREKEGEGRKLQKKGEKKKYTIGDEFGDRKTTSELF